MKRFLPLVLIVAVLAVALGAGWYLTQPHPSSSPSGIASNVQPAVSASPIKPGASPTVSSNSAEPGADPQHAHGPADAPVTLEEFGDFECPPCGLLHPILKAMEQEFGPRLKIVFREFPLVPTHPHALVAARAAEAAGLQGKFWEMHDMIYETQLSWHEAFDARPIFEGYATRIGLDLQRYRQDVDSKAVENRIFQDGKRAHSLGVKGTPTVFMNGREVPFESLAPEKLRGLIQTELSKTK
ncbi:MAG: thioredoxin domain-containing protein [bacterium]